MKKIEKKKSFLSRLFRCTRGETGPLTYIAVAGLTLTTVGTTMAVAKAAARGAAVEVGDRLGSQAAGANGNGSN